MQTIFTFLEPVFDGSLIRLPRTKELFCQPPVLEENISLLSNLCLEGTVQVIQTSRTVDVDPRNIIEVSFVIPYIQLLDDCNLLEVSGIELVRVLHGRFHNGCFEEIFTPSFPPSYHEFHEFYHLHDDVCHTK
jgi:hypothetical protein